ncbi:MAG: hypothetical protein K2H20_01290 [Bacilli bacterium]|nr:hypothetical protein [Bacilli bacterium]
MDKNGIKVSNLYGRARRIELVEKIVYTVVGIIAIALVITLVSKQVENTDDNVNFAYLRRYMEAKGFSCELIHRAGGQCVLSNENSMYSFIRYEDGFEYIIRTQGYTLSIRHKLSEENRIELRTTSEAISGYRNKQYRCSYDESVIGELGTCIDQDENELDLKSYLGLIQQSIVELNRIVDVSGYDKDKLINNYVWEKK